MATVVEERRRGSRARSRSAVIVSDLVSRARESSSTRAAARDAHDETAVAAPRSRAWIVYAVLIAWMVGYVVSLMVRSANSNITWLDGWGVVAVDAVASAACLYRGFSRRLERRPTLILGFALLSWAIGDALITIESLGGGSPSVPSVADAFYILFYPLAYVATVELLQRGLGRLARPNWLDGVVAGVGAAALCATFAFHRIVDLVGGSALSTSVSLAYPIGDLLLLSLVIGGSVLLAGRFSASWVLLAGGLAVIVFGDTFNLFQSSQLATRFGADFNAIAWPTAIILMSMSVWLAPRAGRPVARAAHRGDSSARDRVGGGAGHPRGGHAAGTSSGGRHRPRDRDARAGRRAPGALRAEPARPDRGAPPPGHHRRAHRARQPPPPLPGARRLSSRARPSRRRAAAPGVPLRRPQPLQGDQRLLRPPGRRRAAAPARPAPRRRSSAATGHGGAPRRRRVRRRADGRRRVRRDRGRPAHRRRARGALRARTRSTRASGRASGSPSSRPTRPTRRRSCGAPTWRCTAPSSARCPSSCSTRTSTASENQMPPGRRAGEAVHRRRARAALPAAARPAHRPDRARSRRCCAGPTRGSGIDPAAQVPPAGRGRRAHAAAHGARPRQGARPVRALARRRRRGPRVSVNVSTTNLLDAGFIDLVDELLGPPPRCPPAPAGPRDHRDDASSRTSRRSQASSRACATSACWSRSTTSAPATRRSPT